MRFASGMLRDRRHWAELPSGVIVVFDFRSKRQPKPVPDELNFVLNKCAVEGRSAACVIEHDREAVYPVRLP